MICVDCSLHKKCRVSNTDNHLYLPVSYFQQIPIDHSPYARRFTYITSVELLRVLQAMSGTVYIMPEETEGRDFE